MWATKLVMPMPRSHCTAAVAASVARPSPWRSVPTIHASSALRVPSSSVSVAWTTPTGAPVARSRRIQFSQPALPSGAWPATWRA
jgi:hypothetical protein